MDPLTDAWTMSATGSWLSLKITGPTRYQKYCKASHASHPCNLCHVLLDFRLAHARPSRRGCQISVRLRVWRSTSNFGQKRFRQVDPKQGVHCDSQCQRIEVAINIPYTSCCPGIICQCCSRLLHGLCAPSRGFKSQQEFLCLFRFFPNVRVLPWTVGTPLTLSLRGSLQLAHSS